MAQLLADPRVDTDAYSSVSLRAAAAGGHTATVELLLADPRAQPSARQNQALRLAATYGHIAIVKLLLVDARGLAPFGTGQALRAACAGGHVAVVECLLADPRVQLNNITHDALTILEAAVASGSAAILDLLLADARIRPCSHLADWVIGVAVRARNEELVCRILRYARPSIYHRSCAAGAIAAAAGTGDFELVCAVERWIAAVGMQFAPLATSAVRSAIQGGNVAIFEWTVARAPRAVIVPDTILPDAEDNGRTAILRRLLRAPVNGRQLFHLGDSMVDAALLRACARGDVDVVDALLTHAPLHLELNYACSPWTAEERGVAKLICVARPMLYPWVVLGIQIAGMALSAACIAFSLPSVFPGLLPEQLSWLQQPPPPPACRPPSPPARTVPLCLFGGFLALLVVYVYADSFRAHTTILQQALAEACFLGHTEIVARLLADPRLTIAGTDDATWFLSIAAGDRRVPVVATLLADARVASNISDKQGAAYMHEAAQPPTAGAGSATHDVSEQSCGFDPSAEPRRRILCSDAAGGCTHRCASSQLAAAAIRLPHSSCPWEQCSTPPAVGGSDAGPAGAGAVADTRPLELAPAARACRARSAC